MDGTIPIGTVIERPTGELAMLWRLYAAALEKIELLQAGKRKRKYGNEKSRR